MRKRYIGLITPERDFQELEPAFNKLQKMSEAYAPTSAQHMALQFAAVQIRTAAEFITRRPFLRHSYNSDQIGSKTGGAVYQAQNHGVHNVGSWSVEGGQSGIEGMARELYEADATYNQSVVGESFAIEHWEDAEPTVHARWINIARVVRAAQFDIG